MPFTPLGDTLHDNSEKDAAGKKQLEEAEIIEIAQSVFEEMFEKEMALQAKPLFLKNRTLTVSCSSSAIAGEIRLNQAEIVEKMNEKLGKNEVDRIRYLA
ncbi:hypothetical protein C0581_02125 [Candidatus Parcubacteria bacterium]|nr:MAG: hypothetical protein C0581_02125 [Candidatus Parcubacteria bacterium]